LSGALAELLTTALAGSRAGVAAAPGGLWRSTAILALARRAAAALAARGVQPFEPVHVAIGNRPEDLSALLGVPLAGASTLDALAAGAPGASQTAIVNPAASPATTSANVFSMALSP